MGSLPLNTFTSNFGNFTLLEFDVEAVLNLEISGKRETVADFFLIINSFNIANLCLPLCSLIHLGELRIRRHLLIFLLRSPLIK